MIEYRFNAEPVALERKPTRAATINNAPKVLRGYAAKFGVVTTIGGDFREVIMPGAFTRTIKTDDAIAAFNHDPNWILARLSAGTLRLSEDAIGLRYELDINPRDALSASVAEKVARRDVVGSSFAFSIGHPDDESWEAEHKKLPLRRVYRARLYDIAPVVYPAYPQTEVGAG